MTPTPRKNPRADFPINPPTASEADSGPKTKRASRRKPSPPPEDDCVEPPPPSPRPISPASEAQKPPSADGAGDIPAMSQEMVDAWHDAKPEDDETGYGKPPKSKRFKKGQSGNPSGKRKQATPPPGNRLQNIGHEVVDEMTEILHGQVTDLQVHPDDLVTTALAKIVVGDGLKKDGTARKFILSQFLEKPLQSDRLRPVDPREEEAQILQKMMSAIMDPGLTEEEFNETLNEAAKHHETYGEFGARRRKERKRRRKPRRITS